MSAAPDEKMKRLLEFRTLMQTIRERFPENAFEIDRAIFSVGQKISSCADPHCHCRQMTLEKFHAQQNSGQWSEISGQWAVFSADDDD